MYNENRFNDYIKSNTKKLGIDLLTTIFIGIFYLVISAYDKIDSTTLTVGSRTLFVLIVVASIIKSLISCIKVIKLSYNKNKYLNA